MTTLDLNIPILSCGALLEKMLLDILSAKYVTTC